MKLANVLNIPPLERKLVSVMVLTTKCVNVQLQDGDCVINVEKMSLDELRCVRSCTRGMECGTVQTCAVVKQQRKTVNERTGTACALGEPVR